MEKSSQKEPDSAVKHPDAGKEFRWQAFFQRAHEPVFLLDRRRRILFVNHAWEELTGLSASQARGLPCIRRASLPQDPWDVVIREVCCPPAEVLEGRPGRARRLVPRPSSTPRWWDVEFFPLRAQDRLLCILGKINPLPVDEAASNPPLPETLMALRERSAQRYGYHQLASSLPSCQRVSEQVHLAGQTRVPVLISGEPGTGKRWVARTIHYQGSMREGSFVALDCAKLPSALLSNLLFSKNPGSPSCAGTKYLKEPSGLPRDLQLQLCASIQEAAEGAGARILAGCSTDLKEEIRAGRLAEELACALSTLIIFLPPLRERQADLPSLVERFLQRIHSEKEGPGPRLAPETWDLLRAYTWPGNLCELYTTLQSACQRTTTNRIEPSHLPAKLRLAVHLEQTSPSTPDCPLRLDHILEEAERRLIIAALRKAHGNRNRAAELLSIWRPRLLRRMEALGIEEW
jgi:transcriptional regulator with PAS, ATPase and Fis domain